MSEVIISEWDECGWSVHVGQLAEVAPMGEDANPKLLRPFEVSGHRRHVLPQDVTARPQLRHKGGINLPDLLIHVNTFTKDVDSSN